MEAKGGTYCDGVRSSGKGLAAHVREETGNLVLVDLIQLGLTTLTGIHDVLPQELLGNFTLLLLFSSLFLSRTSGHLLWGRR